MVAAHARLVKNTVLAGYLHLGAQGLKPSIEMHNDFKTPWKPITLLCMLSTKNREG